MPGDVMVNFYINLSKLCLTVYQLHVLPPNTTKVSREMLPYRLGIHRKVLECDLTWLVYLLIQ